MKELLRVGKFSKAAKQINIKIKFFNIQEIISFLIALKSVKYTEINRKCTRSRESINFTLDMKDLKRKRYQNLGRPNALKMSLSYLEQSQINPNPNPNII